MNNVFGIMNAMKNPQAFMQQIGSNSQIMNNPITRNAFEMYQKGDTDGLKTMAENLCREKGVKPEDVLNQIKGNLGL